MEACQAGASPKIIPVANEIARLYATTRQSMLISRNARRADVAHRLAPQQSRSPVGEKKPHAAAAYSEQQAFRQELPNQAGPAGTDREANGNFPAAGRRSREQEICDVRTSDQKNERDSSDHHEERLNEMAVIGGVQRLDSNIPAVVGLGIFLRKPGSDRVHLSLRLLTRDARFHAGESFEVTRGTSVPSLRCAGEGERHENVNGRVPGELKIARHDADNRVAARVEHDGFAENVTSAREPALPQPVTHDCDGILACDRFFIQEEASQPRLHAEHRQEAAGHLKLNTRSGAFSRIKLYE